MSISFSLMMIGLLAAGVSDNPIHTITLEERVLVPEDGLLLGNGDLSVSVYQTADRIIWRFGKADVWDRRLDLSADPKPANIAEIAHGIEVEGWKCPPYGDGPPVATRGTQNPERMKELCQGAPPSYNKRPYPCPKPVGELALFLPPDQMGLKIHQELRIEEAILTITCSRPSGVRILIETFIPPSPNVLVVHWEVENWTDQTRTGNGNAPVWFALYRWKDPSIQEFGAKFFGDYRHGAFRACSDPSATPLPPPTLQESDGLRFIEQTFPADPTFPNGFRYVMAPFAPGMAVETVDMNPTGEARLHLMPPVASEGWMTVAVATTGDPEGPMTQVRQVQEALGEHPADTMNRWAEETRSKAAEFWTKSRVSIADPLLENLWYETLHARRCTNRPDIAPPGLFLPSTVQDYSHWHGDYHTNYNLQEPFWADYTANHLDLGDAYFKAIEFFLPIGRKIAHDYYNGRGAFIQLSGYPIVAEDDPLGCVPMGRMAYMTGWAINQYWWRYLYTLDQDWLRTTGYPVIRECALFYTDFLKKGSDGLYHAFPSNQGEDGFTGDPKDYTDRAQIMQHLRYCLRAAIRSSEILSTDPELRAQWQEQLDHCAGDDGKPPSTLQGLEKQCQEANPPEFGYGRPYTPQPGTAEGAPWPPVGDGSWTWYCGQYGWGVLQRLHGGEFIADRDFPVFRKLLERWRHPNGLIWGMAIANYGHAGAWTETLGIMAPLQEMMLQSWDGALRVFPAWPKTVAASFENFRAQGAFLASASWEQGRITDLKIMSEKGGECRVYEPWPSSQAEVFTENGTPVEVAHEIGMLHFQTAPGAIFVLRNSDGDPKPAG
ncbi:MAG TPA: hypothetical protein PLI09_04625 [Candidatus Hydrogenedentes bacterium]|nr:hypothetical protein [Candidatus Hydrogenedentota bacterium]